MRSERGGDPPWRTVGVGLQAAGLDVLGQQREIPLPVGIVEEDVLPVVARSTGLTASRSA